MQKKVDAFQQLLGGESTTFERLRAVRGALSGIDPRFDAVLREYDRHVDILEHALQGDVIDLSAKTLPETSDEERKRKAAILLFLRVSKDLQSEMERVKGELEKQQGDNNISTWQKIFGGAKGPLGIVTVLAIGGVLLHTTASEIEIHNDGCGTLMPSVSIPVPLPGLSLPSTPIPTGGKAIAVIPPVPLTVDGLESGKLLIRALGLKLTFVVGDVDDVTFDGESLIGKKTNVDLFGGEKHRLTLLCQSR